METISKTVIRESLEKWLDIFIVKSFVFWNNKASIPTC